MTPERQEYLFRKYFLQSASPEEEQELMQWLSLQHDEKTIAHLMDKAWDEFSHHQDIFTQEQSSQLLQQALQSRPAPVIRSRWFQWKRMAIAASVLVLAGAGSIWLLRQPAEKIAPVLTAKTASFKDITPATDKAILTLANGEQIILDDAANGDLTSQSGIQVIKLNGQLSYKASSASTTGEIIYNTINTSKGKQYRLILEDGSSVWLNAASSLRFPVNFPKDQRQVELNGEAYFEVAKDSRRPFQVALRSAKNEEKGTVNVLGTRFNVNSYDNESSCKTTLLNGSVRVCNKKGKAIIPDPGQQVQLTEEKLILLRDANTEQVLAWKNNLFNFDNERIEDIMRQLARWYDITVSYEGVIPDKHYFGSIRRQVNLSEIIHMLEIAGGIQFTTEGRNIHIKAQ